MSETRFYARFRQLLSCPIILFFVTGSALAQGTSIATLNDDPLNSSANSTPVRSVPANGAAIQDSSALATSLPEAPASHNFWDDENRILFAAVAGLSAADFALTRSILQNGGRELNPVTRLFSGSTAGLAVNFGGETAAVIGLSYLLHKTGHHRLERLAPMLNIAASSFAVAYDLAHR